MRLPVTLLLASLLPVAALAGMPDQHALGTAKADAAAARYASIPHVVIVAKRMTPEEKRRQVEQERLAAQRHAPRLAAK